MASNYHFPIKVLKRGRPAGVCETRTDALRVIYAVQLTIERKYIARSIKPHSNLTSGPTDTVSILALGRLVGMIPVL